MPLSIERVTSKDVMELLDGLQSADGIFCVDQRQRIIHWSRSAQQVLGHAAREVLGRPCHEVLATRDSQNYRFCRPDCPIVTNARRGRLTHDYDVLTRTKDGADVWVNVSILLLRVKGSRSPFVVHLIRDVTERRRVEGLARRAVESLRDLTEKSGEFPGGTSGPDLRPTPLPALSRRELQVLQLLASGLGTRQIADSLGISPVTARNHITHVVSKLGARNRLEAVLYASRRRLI
jgi:PAS domain S-box-containing protein